MSFLAFYGENTLKIIMTTQTNVTRFRINSSIFHWILIWSEKCLMVLVYNWVLCVSITINKLFWNFSLSQSSSTLWRLDSCCLDMVNWFSFILDLVCILWIFCDQFKAYILLYTVSWYFEFLFHFFSINWNKFAINTNNCM